MTRYTFLGDKQTRRELRGMQCDPVRRPDGKCVLSVKMATALVVDENGIQYVVPRRRLRLNEMGRGGGEVVRTGLTPQEIAGSNPARSGPTYNQLKP